MMLTSRAPVSYTHLRAHETKANLVCRLLLEKKKKIFSNYIITHSRFIPDSTKKNHITPSVFLLACSGVSCAHARAAMSANATNTNKSIRMATPLFYDDRRPRRGSRE